MVLFARRSRLASRIASAIVLVSENEDAVRKNIEKMHPGGYSNVFLLEKMEFSEEEELDIVELTTQRTRLRPAINSYYYIRGDYE